MPDNLVACDVGGTIARIVAPVGKTVAAGDPLMIIDVSGHAVTLDAPVSGWVKAQYFGPNDLLPEAAIVALIET